MGDENEIREESFTATERLLLSGILSANEVASPLLGVQLALHAVLSLDEEELTTAGAVAAGGQVLMRQDADSLLPAKVLRIGPHGRGLIRAALKRLDQAGKLRNVHAPLWRRFVGPLTGDAEA